ncbi:MAG: hypothetical protein HY961_15710 [Ignavibacteriae bacterium]|nr:hypothetical protein [Ignavibacteriota bacterium]
MRLRNWGTTTFTLLSACTSILVAQVDRELKGTIATFVQNKGKQVAAADFQLTIDSVASGQAGDTEETRSSIYPIPIRSS